MPQPSIAGPPRSAMPRVPYAGSVQGMSALRRRASELATANDVLLAANRALATANGVLLAVNGALALSNGALRRDLARRRTAACGPLPAAGGAGPAAPARPLSPREREVLRLVAEGRANKETAAVLGIGLKTVGKHREHLMRKLDIHETAGLTRYAIAVGIVANVQVASA